MLLHDEGSRIIKLIDEKKGGVKNLVFSSQFKNKGKLNALVCETLKYTSVLDKIIDATDLAKRAKLIKDKYLCRIVVYEFLFGKADSLQSKYLDALKKNSASLNAELAKIKIKMKVSDNKDLVDNLESRVKLPRYVRVNTLCMKFNDVLEHFKGEKYTLLPSFAYDYESFLEKVSNLGEKEFMKDPHVPELLIFSHGTSFYKHPLYNKGVLLLQDKASCLPALALAPPPNSQVIDSCAAPGNKTSYLAALMNNTGKIYAFDKDGRRFNNMSAMLFKAKAVNVEMKNEDFLKVKTDHPKYSGVEYVLADPSCSGSGIMDRVDLTGNDVNSISTSDDKLESRLNSLSNFQAMLLGHVFMFPKVKKVVYSTCSIHEQENEAVVREVLSKNPSFELQRLFPKISSRGINKDGLDEFDMTNCVRLNPDKDLTNGFFVACFVKNQNFVPGCAKTNCELTKKSQEKVKRKASDSPEEADVVEASGTKEVKVQGEKKAKRSKANEPSDENKANVLGGADNPNSSNQKERKLLKKRQRQKHKKPIIFINKNEQKKATQQ